jgi:hypothetical protein
MSTTNLSFVSARFQKAAESLKLQDSEVPKLKEALSAFGIDEDGAGLKYLNSRVISQEDIVEILTKNFEGKGKFCIKAASMYLKGEDPFGEETPKVVKPDNGVSSDTSSSAIIEFIQANKPIGQMTDTELLTMWNTNRDENMEQELNRRSRSQAFIVLKPGKHIPGKEIVDIAYSLELLKAARKRTNPTIVPYEENTFATVYKITELNINDRIIDTCPICGEILWKGYCSACESNFSGVGDDERAYVKLVVDAGKINPKSASDRKALGVCASKGIDSLKAEWPGIAKQFDELKVTGNLPKLKRIADRPAQVPVELKDPFHVSGKRQF